MRNVEVSDQVFWTLEAIFSVSADTRPAQSEFTSHELFPVRDYFAEHWDNPSSRLIDIGTAPVRKSSTSKGGSSTRTTSSLRS